MRKFLLLLCSALCIACLLCTVAACDKQEEHNFGEWIAEVPATCTEAGTVGHYHCTHCDKDFDRDGNELGELTIAALGHTPEEVEGQSATCTEPGYTAGTKCSRCQTLLTAHVTQEPLGHDPVKVVGQPATCLEDGLSDCYECDRCHKFSLTEDGDYTGDSAAEVQTTLTATGHSYGEWRVTQGATCTETGTKERICDNCTDVQTDTVDMVGHSPEIVPGLPETCTADGYTTCYQCSMCEKYASDYDGDFVFATAEEARTTLTATGHDWGEWSVFEEATEQSEGKQIRTCSNCRQNEFKDIPSKDHDWGTWQDNGDGYHVRKCQTADCGAEQKEACMYDNGETFDATCTEGEYTVYTCSVCNHKNETAHGDPLGHQYGAWEPLIVRDTQDADSPSRDTHKHQHTHICTRCNDPESRQTVDCTMDNAKSFEATCTTAAYTETTCSECGSVHEEVTAPANGHALEYNHVFYGGTLLNCGHYQKCATCGYTTDEEPCKSKIVVHEATCTSDRYSEYTCEVCHMGKKIPEANSALGHKIAIEFVGTFDEPQHRIHCTRQGCDYDETVACDITSTEQLPTCTKAGSVSKACKVCMYSATQTGSGETVDHVWSAYTQLGTDQHTRQCTKCGLRDTQAHNYQVTKEEVATCDKPKTVTETCIDCDHVRVTTDGTAGGHIWVVDKVYEDHHEAKCINCTETSTHSHDWSESNLCSVCGYDGLDYQIDGVHCTVTGSKKVPLAKNIVIKEYHEVLDGNGGYELSQYRVEYIKDMAFQGHKNLTTLTFPSTVKEIGNYAFIACTKLEKVTLTGEEHNLVKIGDRAFSSCGALVTFDPPATLQYIGASAFENCTSLEYIEIGDNVTEIGSKAFFNTAYVNSAEHWPEGALYIGSHLIKVYNLPDGDDWTNKEFTVRPGTVSIACNAFSDCKHLVKLVLPSSLLVVDYDAFLNCTSIEAVEYQGDFDQWFRIRFENDYSSPLHYGTPSFHLDGASGNIRIPDGTTRIPAGTFRGTPITRVEIPASVTYIGEEAFENCASLETITFLGNGVTYIGKDAFKDCAYYLENEHWTKNVLYINNYLIKAKDVTGNYVVEEGTLLIANNAFSGCSGLTGVRINAELLYIGNGAFADCASMNSLTFTEQRYCWFASGVIGRALEVTTNMWNAYKYPYNGEWHRLEILAN